MIWCLRQDFTDAATAKSLQSCPTLYNPIEGSPPGSPITGLLPARTLEWVAISFSKAWKWKVKAKSLSHVRLFETPWTAAHQAPLSMGFSRQEYWSGVPLPSPFRCWVRCKYWIPLLPGLDPTYQTTKHKSRMCWVNHYFFKASEEMTWYNQSACHIPSYTLIQLWKCKWLKLCPSKLSPGLLLKLSWHKNPI